MEIITREKLKQEIKARKNYLRSLKKEMREQEKKLREAQTKEEIKDLYITSGDLREIETGVKEEIISIKELLELGVEKISVEYE